MNAELSARERREIEEAMLERELDPDFALVADYAAGALPPDAAETVRLRIEQDPEFRELAAPVLLAWESRPAEPVDMAELTRAWLQLRRRAGMPAVPGQNDPALAGDVAAFNMRMERERSRRVRRRALQFAAAFAVLLAAPYAAVRYLQDVAPGGERPATGFVGIPTDHVQQVLAPGTTGTFPDGSTWTVIRPGTSVSFVGRFREGRVVYVEGDARFEVVKGAGDFVVHTPGAEITVTGTRFTVTTAADGTTTVSVHEGEVRLRGRFDDPTRHRRVSVLPAGQTGKVRRNAQPEGGLIYDGFRPAPAR